MFKRETKKYENGLLHVHYYVPFLKTMTMSFVLKTGSAAERRHKYFGIAHFLEHMLFNGSTKYPDAQETFRLASKHGLYQNAWTSTSETIYYTGATRRSAKVGFDILFDNIFHPILRESDVEKEIGIIQEERVMREQDPVFALMFELLRQINIGTTYSHRTIGVKESIGGITKEMLEDFHQIHYAPNNTVFISYGGVEMETIQDIADESLKSLVSEDVPEHTDQLLDGVDADAYESGNKTIFLERDTDVVYYQSLIKNEMTDDLNDVAKALLVRTILSSGYAALLDQELLINNSLVSDYDAVIYFKKDHILFHFDTSFEASKEKEVIDTYENVIVGFKNRVSDTVFERAKNFAYGSYIRNVEDSFYPTGSGLLNIERFNYLLDKGHSLKDLQDAINKVEKNDLIEYAENFFASTKRINGFVHKK